MDDLQGGELTRYGWCHTGIQLGLLYRRIQVSLGVAVVVVAVVVDAAIQFSAASPFLTLSILDRRESEIDDYANAAVFVHRRVDSVSNRRQRLPRRLLCLLPRAKREAEGGGGEERTERWKKAL